MVGAVITLAVPGNRVGWLLLAAAAIMGIGSGCTEAGIHGVVTDPGSLPGAAYLAGLGPGLQAAGMLMAVVGVPAVFPDGRLHWRSPLGLPGGYADVANGLSSAGVLLAARGGSRRRGRAGHPVAARRPAGPPAAALPRPGRLPARLCSSSRCWPPTASPAGSSAWS